MKNVSKQSRSPLLEQSSEPESASEPKEMSTPRRSSARALLKHAGTWVGNDAEECLKVVYAARGEAIF
jgi:hypothetical protein